MTGSTFGSASKTSTAHRGFDAIDPSDLRGRMRWWGLYTQRRPGIGGGLTGSLEPEELDDRFFMLRVRIDGGRLTSEQLRAIADVSTEYGRDTADVTDRQNIQLHWIRIEDMPAIWQRLEATGLSTTEACGDTPRVFLGCPLAGDDANEIIDGTGVHQPRPSRRYVGSPEFSNLPRKFKTAFSGCPDHCSDPRDQRRLVRRRLRRPTARPDTTSGSAAACPPTQACRAGRRVRDRGAGARGVGRGDVDLP